MNLGLLLSALSVVIAAALFSSGSVALTPDGIALLEFKSTLNDTKNILSNWQALDDSPCGWTGISCYPDDQRVQS
ncbi:hypothetical protein CRG98_016367, partial [Punica granatum]